MSNLASAEKRGVHCPRNLGPGSKKNLPGPKKIRSLVKIFIKFLIKYILLFNYFKL